MQEPGSPPPSTLVSGAHSGSAGLSCLPSLHDTGPTFQLAAAPGKLSPRRSYSVAPPASPRKDRAPRGQLV